MAVTELRPPRFGGVFVQVSLPVAHADRGGRVEVTKCVFRDTGKATRPRRHLWLVESPPAAPPG